MAEATCKEQSAEKVTGFLGMVYESAILDKAVFLHELLTNPTFVDFLNAFLAKPGLGPHLYFNRRVCAFEELKRSTQDTFQAGKVSWGPKFTPPTLLPPPPADFITEDTFIESLDVMSSIGWVQTELLPLFILSDFYGQFRLCQLLTSNTAPSAAKLPAFCAKMRLPWLYTEPQVPGLDLSDLKLREEAIRMSSKEPLDEDVVRAVANYYDRVGRTHRCQVRDTIAFVAYLATTSGIRCWNFWLSADQALANPPGEERYTHATKLRKDAATHGSPVQLDLPLLAFLRAGRDDKELAEMVVFVQNRMLKNLYHYWFPRFMVHSFLHNEELPRVIEKAKAKDGTLEDLTATAHHKRRWQDFKACSQGLSTFPTEDSVYAQCTLLSGNKEKDAKSVDSRRRFRGRPPPIPTAGDSSWHPPLVARKFLQAAESTTRFVHGELRRQLVSALEVDLTLRGEYFLDKIAHYADEDTDINMDLVENWVNFWRDVLSYRALFVHDWFNAQTVRRQAMMMFSVYILSTARRCVQVTPRTEEAISRGLNAPNDDLFDDAEEEILKRLQPIWASVLKRDISRMKESVKSRMEFDFKYCHPEKAAAKKVEKDRAAKKGKYPDWPAPVQEMTFHDILRDRLELEYFKAFLNEKDAARDLMCWFDVEAFRHCPHDTKERHLQARKVRFLYLTNDYIFHKTGPATKLDIEELLKAAAFRRRRLVGPRPSTPVLQTVQNIVEQRLESHWVPQFLMSREFRLRRRRGDSINVLDFDTDNVRDTVRERKSTSPSSKYKVSDELRSQHMRDMSLFRKALKDPQLATEFHRYACIKGGKLEADLTFWKEVQKFKHLIHSRSSIDVVRRKYQAIYSRFLDSQIPPKVQISITDEQAATYTTKPPTRISPYFFRIAQVEVFGTLFPEWIVFSGWRAEHLAQSPDDPLSFDDLIAEREKEDRQAQQMMDMQQREDDSGARSKQAKGPQFVLESEQLTKQKKLVDFKLSDYLLQQEEQEKQEKQLEKEAAAEAKACAETLKPDEGAAAAARTRKSLKATVSVSQSAMSPSAPLGSTRARGSTLPEVVTLVRAPTGSRHVRPLTSPPGLHLPPATRQPTRVGQPLRSEMAFGGLRPSRTRPTTTPASVRLGNVSRHHQDKEATGTGRARRATLQGTSSVHQQSTTVSWAPPSRNFPPSSSRQHAAAAGEGSGRLGWQVRGTSQPPPLASTSRQVQWGAVSEQGSRQQAVATAATLRRQPKQLQQAKGWKMASAPPLQPPSYLVTESKTFDPRLPKGAVQLVAVDAERGKSPTATETLRFSLAATLHPSKFS